MTRTLFSFFLFLFLNSANALPDNFVYLHDIDPSIEEDMRYASVNNFTGQKVIGYQKGRCILSASAATQLAKAQKAAKRLGYRFKVYDCYRPKRAVEAFYIWSQDASDQRTKSEFYPREIKSTLFDKGYIARESGHSRGSTVDLTLVKIHNPDKPNPVVLKRCYSRTNQYSNDNSFNAGTRFDCLDVSANVFYADLTRQQKANRFLLRNVMIDNGFIPYEKEWWHFTLKQEPYPRTYFDFIVK